jgi:glutathione S-transferase
MDLDGSGGNSDSAPAAASVVDLDKAHAYLGQACTLADLAVVVISRFIDPKEVASLSDFTDKTAYISEVHAHTDPA